MLQAIAVALDIGPKKKTRAGPSIIQRFMSGKKWS
jgi:hypothetical protein